MRSKLKGVSCRYRLGRCHRRGKRSRHGSRDCICRIGLLSPANVRALSIALLQSGYQSPSLLDVDTDERLLILQDNQLHTSLKKDGVSLLTLTVFA